VVWIQFMQVPYVCEARKVLIYNTLSSLHHKHVISFTVNVKVELFPTKKIDQAFSYQNLHVNPFTCQLVCHLGSWIGMQSAWCKIEPKFLLPFVIYHTIIVWRSESLPIWGRLQLQQEFVPPHSFFVLLPSQALPHLWFILMYQAYILLELVGAV
jgi:hypothetical protein